jgi:hypothetical protein
MIIFEGDSCRDWIQKLARRMQVAVESAKGNSYFEGEFKPDLDELVAIQEALERANEQLEILSSAPSRRERRTSGPALAIVRTRSGPTLLVLEHVAPDPSTSASGPAQQLVRGRRSFVLVGEVTRA